MKKWRAARWSGRMQVRPERTARIARSFRPAAAAITLMMICNSIAPTVSGVAHADPAEMMLQNLDLSDAWRSLVLSHAERNVCRSYRLAGHKDGVTAFFKLFPTCSDMLLGSSDFTATLEAKSRETDCYGAGFTEGFALTAAKRWMPCSKVFGDAIAAANREAVIACREDAERRGQAFKERDAAVREALKRRYGIRDDEDLLTKVAQYTAAGFGQEAWPDVVKLGVSGQIDIVACTLINLAEMERAGSFK